MVEEAARGAVRLDPTLDTAQVTVVMTRVDEIWEQLFPDEQARIVKLLVEKVILLCHISDSRRRQAAKASCLRRCRS